MNDTRNKELTGEQLAALRAKAIASYNVGELIFTCDNCRDRYICKYVFDLYNTDGDCLAEK